MDNVYKICATTYLTYITQNLRNLLLYQIIPTLTNYQPPNPPPPPICGEPPMPIPPIAVGNKQVIDEEMVRMRTKNRGDIKLEITQSTKQRPSHQLNKGLPGAAIPPIIPPIAVGKIQVFEQELVRMRKKNAFDIKSEINPTQSTKQTPTDLLNNRITLRRSPHAHPAHRCR